MKSQYAGYADQAELDAAYDVENSAPDFMIYANKFMADSEAAEAAVPNKRLGVPYGPTVMENLDIFMPQTKSPARLRSSCSSTVVIGNR